MAFAPWPRSTACTLVARQVVLGCGCRNRASRTEHLFLDVDSGAWAVLWESGGRWLVRQSGPVRIWDAIEEQVGRWRVAGAPRLERFEITVASDRLSVTWPLAR
ncbi:hypothetical protein SGFS_078150 [Streptomyces graminofaciens]|uniref:Uncharacterized protein n=1 Tax=Streptomyces graminofaciens TaxID=68212 RepID=A0ABM7FIM6_9ACTN|nr:hypothetical protein SGFS_078150 [Streptomyces graminofaciens]